MPDALQRNRAKTPHKAGGLAPSILPQKEEVIQVATLYNLTDDYLNLLMLAEDPDVDPQILKDTMEAIGGEIEEKADGYAMVMKELEAQEIALKMEIDRLTNRRLAISNNITCMKRGLESAMRLTGKTKFKTTLFSFGIQKNPPSVVMDEQYIENIPEDYLKYKDPEIDKKRILADLKAGKDLEGIAHIVQTESLRIR